MLSGKNILLGVSGSIAAYKAVYLARLCVEAGADVWPIMTTSATRFVGPLTFSSLTGHRSVTDMWSATEAGVIGHVELAHLASLLVVAPATADVIARLVDGRADEPLTAIALATRAPWVVAPAMEEGMWRNQATQRHVSTLAERGVKIVSPGEGTLASGRSGVGRLAEPEVIFEDILATLSKKDLAGERVLVTAGPTREAFDPARFISNASSGKMGFALARIAKRRGATVRLVTGPTHLTPPTGIEVVRVTTTEQMLNACSDGLESFTILLMAAAPADYRPAAYSSEKQKKSVGEITAALEQTPDILMTLKARAKGVCTVGFAAESNELIMHARSKLEAKDLDLIVANDITRPDAGFASDTNAVILLDKGGVTPLPVMTKEAVAEAVLDRVTGILAFKRATDSSRPAAS